MQSPQISAGIIPYFQKEKQYYFLCIKHQKWHRWFPKWQRELWESEEQTAIREFQEETGIQDIEIIKASKITETFFIQQQNIQKIVTFFLGKIWSDWATNIHLQARELAEYFIGTYDEVYEKLTYDEAKKTFKYAFNRLSQRQWN